MASSLIEVDSVEILVIVDNEVDPVSRYINEGVAVLSRFIDFGINSPNLPTDRSDQCRELKMDALCCGAHGLPLMIVGPLQPVVIVPKR
jgi:7,8-dihydropterin-6-yl-methyl-4-(beta-D-ribofuranosyl)aminobenzene 5'-phosphate synthase